MDRLTTDKPVSEMGMVELAYNGCFAKNGEAFYRDFDNEVSARELARILFKKYADGDDAFSCDEDFDDEMIELLSYGTDTIEGLLALFYRNLWAMADLRETLKRYEDLGTVEEFKALSDKRTVKNPIRNDMCTCPTCGTHNEIIQRRRNTVNLDSIFCWHCGQAISVEQMAD